MIELTGEYTDAKVMGLSRDEIEENTLEQLQSMIDHEAFTNPVRVAPDCHVGNGAVIGFTMEVGDRIIPNVIGVDIGCFAGDTEVKLLDGNDYRMDELARRDDGFEVYSCTPDGEIVPTKATAHKTRSDAPLIAIELDNGELIRCTPDHEFMLRDGSYEEARNLTEGTSLMPLYTGETDDGYQLVYHNERGPVEDRGVRAHWLVARSNLMDIPKNMGKVVLHHKNFIKNDNRPDNLEFMNPSDHSKLHRELSKNDWWQSEEFERARIETLGNREPTQREIEAATENIRRWMDENPETFAEVTKQNGERGKEYLKEFNTTERSCSICGETCANPASEYWHQVREHPHKTEYKLSSNAESKIADNHKVVSVTSLDVTEDVYCLNVPETGNFALSAGVFVHNCGMFSANLGADLPVTGDELDQRVRAKVPMGWGPDGLKAPERGRYHIVNDFPWEEVNNTLAAFIEMMDGPWVDYMEEFHENGGYDREYLDALVARARTMSNYVNMNNVIGSVGTLGSGNHFIEIGQSVETGDYWVTVHSGSRGLGEKTAQYHQKKAGEHLDEKYNRDDRAERIRELLAEYPSEYVVFDVDDVSDEDLRTWVTGGMGEDFINYDAIQPEQREEYRDELKEATRIAQENGDTAESLDYLVGDEAGAYLVDMIFCQRYASESRKMMARAVADGVCVELGETIESVHNFIDFRDGVIRKGATRSYEGELAIVPFNMRDGTLLVEGKSNEEWQYSVCHGAGRLMSRGEACRTFSEEDVAETMEDAGAFATAFPNDEAPGAYKPADLIENAIQDTATIVDRLEVVHNWKADD
jgi:tRNA-splicing ligase RtcB